MLRAIFAFLVGAVAMSLTVAGVQMIGHHLWPLPSGIDPNSHEQMATIVEAMPVAAKAWVVLAYAIATAVSVLVATAIARARWKGLGIALPQGAMALFEPAAGGEQLAAQTDLRDYARGQDVELQLGQSAQVFAICGNYTKGGRASDIAKWSPMRAVLTNANPHPVTLRLQLGWGGQYDIRLPRGKPVLKNGWQTVELRIPANATRTFDWKAREALQQ